MLKIAVKEKSRETRDTESVGRSVRAEEDGRECIASPRRERGVVVGACDHVRDGDRARGRGRDAVDARASARAPCAWCVCARARVREREREREERPCWVLPIRLF